MSGVQTRLDGATLVVRIPMRFQHRGGRKRIVAPDGSAIVPTSKPQPDGALVKALARAWRWQRMLDDGIYTTVSDIGDAENISKSYVSRILQLALLAPEIIETIVVGKWRPVADAGEAGAAVAGELGGAAHSHSRAEQAVSAERGGRGAAQCPRAKRLSGTIYGFMLLRIVGAARRRSRPGISDGTLVGAQIMSLRIEQLTQAVAQDAAIRRVRRLQPAGDAGDKIFPPTYPGEGNAPAGHVFETRRINGHDVRCVLIDSV